MMNNIRKPFLESLDTVFEDKTSMIKKLVLPDIEDASEKEAYKQELISFFKSHSNFENKIDWNKFKTLTKKDFDNLIASADQTKNAKRRKEKAEIDSDVKNIFKNQKGRQFKIIGENDRWLFVSPLNYRAAKFCDSSENQGAGAKWCIGYEKTDEYWNDYVYEKNSLFTMAFNKNYKNLSQEELQTNLKYMIEKTKEGDYNVWSQKDENKGSNFSIVGQEKSTADKMFEKIKKVFEDYNKLLEKNANEKVEKILKGVNEIGEKTLKKYKRFVTKIDIPNNVTNIEYAAFNDCNSLTSITIPDSVTNIGWNAFLDCANLTSVIIPDSVKSIGPGAFHGCSGLTSMTIPDSVTSIGHATFRACSGLTSVTIPNSIKSIGAFAFRGCRSLTSITIPDSVTSIGEDAFFECNGLTTITIPDSVTSIRPETFTGCSNLTSITIPDSVTSISGRVFYNCNNLKTVYCSEKIWNEFRDKFPEDAERKDPSEAPKNESRNFKVKNYKGNIIESLERFSRKYNLKIIEVSENGNELKIKAMS